YMFFNENFFISLFWLLVNLLGSLDCFLAVCFGPMGRVKSARVHLAMPNPSLFLREQKSPSSSVTVTLEPGRSLDEGQISAVLHLFSSA
ncbi:flagellar basal-body MS-ring/collar protein FliF, partial [Salmonella enterica subsp. enterica serovar Infantis]